MKLLDTCVWIEAIIGSATGERLQSVLLDKQNLLVPTLVQFELRRWALRELDEARADDIVLATREGQVVSMDEGVALLAADLAASHKLHALDALIYATALLNKAELVTCDAHFKGLPQVEYVAKLK
jgi:predicted nucleic acid-binding protein